MLLKRFYHDGLAQASYLVGCQKTGEALVVDPNRDADQYIAAATENGLRISLVTETHIHADFLSGSRELAARAGARLRLSGEGGSDWTYRFAAADGDELLRDGDSFMVGNIRIDVVHTPGHTPEHLTFVVTDTPASDQPLGALTGDFIFVGDVGRPDLLERAAQVKGSMRAGAAQLYASLVRFAGRYPDFLQLWPGHGSGSACGKALGAVPQTTLGYEKVANWALQSPDEASFVESVLDGQPDPPRYFATMKRMNRDGPHVLGAQAAVPPCLAPSDLSRVLDGGGTIVDVRAATAFAGSHVPGTINIPFNRAFVGWAGWLLDYDRDVYLLTGTPDDALARTVARELSLIGIDRVAGWFGDDALAEWAAAGRPLGTVSQAEPNELAQWMAERPVTVIDVRRADEWAEGHLDGAHLAPLGRLGENLASLTLDRRVVVQCQSGSRSAIAASLLAAHGVRDVWNLRGGYTGWRKAGLAVVRDGVEAGTT